MEFFEEPCDMVNRHVTTILPLNFSQSSAIKYLLLLENYALPSLKEKIKEIARDFHLTTIIVTHDPEEALTLSDKVLIVNKGCISQYGAPQEIITTPQNNFVKEFILNQLEIKRNNIFALFHQSMTATMQAV